ncbi:MAG: methoxymalonyl-ACP biosynthesis protein [Rhodospirillales bacterium]|nr:methoxymalonyl-ACP biosynthesis protein [Rhodospirillales bacterium]
MLVGLANLRMDFLRTNRLDRLLLERFPTPPAALQTKPIRLALLASSTADHLLPAIRIAALRRGLWVTIYTNQYGQYQQELLDGSSPLHLFAPDIIVFAFDARHLAHGIGAGSGRTSDSLADSTTARLVTLWQTARAAFGCPIIQQTALQVFPALIGNNEHRFDGSAYGFLQRLNARLRTAADAERIELLALDDRAAADGIAAWYDPVMWHRAKQEVHPAAAPLYGDMIGRLLASLQGRSFKCLVLDLDNTLWGGVIGDDGLDGIVLGQGSARGESFVEFQEYVRDLAQRGIILAVCSKNDEANALAPFHSHPDMVLKRSDIAAFVANWDDKPANLRRIARQLNIGIDALVFADDNPFERDIVRRNLPMVAVPELPVDPAFYSRAIADGGYFETLSVTPEDVDRAAHYQANLERTTLQAAATDLPQYLKSLDMVMHSGPFDKVGLQRIVQLINKTNQFNLTTRRYTEEEVLAQMADPQVATLQLRLLDRFGDNGMIAVVIGRIDDRGRDFTIDSWLMSCRVLGRQAEVSTLQLIVEAARQLGAERLVGEYCPTAKNAMVCDHYAKLGFDLADRQDDGASRWVLPLASFAPTENFIANVRKNND